MCRLGWCYYADMYLSKRKTELYYSVLSNSRHYVDWVGVIVHTAQTRERNAELCYILMRGSRVNVQ